MSGRLLVTEKKSDCLDKSPLQPLWCHRARSSLSRQRVRSYVATHSSVMSICIEWWHLYSLPSSVKCRHLFCNGKRKCVLSLSEILKLVFPGKKVHMQDNLWIATALYLYQSSTSENSFLRANLSSGLFPSTQLLLPLKALCCHLRRLLPAATGPQLCFAHLPLISIIYLWFPELKKHWAVQHFPWLK